MRIIFIHKFYLPKASESKVEEKTPQDRRGSDGCERNKSILINLINEANLSHESTLIAFSAYFHEQGNVILWPSLLD